jgi:hypothetical protein
MERVRVVRVSVVAAQDSAWRHAGAARCLRLAPEQRAAVALRRVGAAQDSGWQRAGGERECGERKCAGLPLPELRQR